MSDGDGIALSLTNLFFLVSAAEAVSKHRWTRAFIYFLLTFVSGLYHACYSEMQLCFLSPGTHQDFDFFLSYLLIPLSALYFIQFTPKWAFVERWLIMSFAFIIVVLRIKLPWEDHMIIEFSIAGTSIGMVILYLCGYVAQYRKLPPYNWNYVGLSVVLILVSFVFFIWQDTFGYAVSHSLWHVLAAFGQVALLRTRKAAPRNADMDSMMHYVGFRIIPHI